MADDNQPGRRDNDPRRKVGREDHEARMQKRVTRFEGQMGWSRFKPATPGDITMGGRFPTAEARAATRDRITERTGGSPVPGWTSQLEPTIKNTMRFLDRGTSISIPDQRRLIGPGTQLMGPGFGFNEFVQRDGYHNVNHRRDKNPDPNAGVEVYDPKTKGYRKPKKGDNLGGIGGEPKE